MLENELKDPELPKGAIDVLNKRTTDRIGETLAERGHVHGNIENGANVTYILYNELLAGWEDAKPDVRMGAVERQCLYYICGKLARFVVGDHEHRDHLDDVCGYATLLADHIEKHKWGGSE